jgi:hypothetical protein
MIESVAIIIFLAAAFFCALLACSARTTERLLIGSALCSLGLGLAVQVSGGSYYGLMMLSAFIVTDVVVYLYLRTKNIVPSRQPKNKKADMLFRIFFLWLSGCGVGGAALLLFNPGNEIISVPSTKGSLTLLHEHIWGADWLLLFVPMLSLVALVIGGFLLVRRER